MSAVNVGYEVELQISISIWLQGLCHHNGSTAKSSAMAKLAGSTEKAHRSEPPIPILMIVLIFFPV